MKFLFLGLIALIAASVCSAQVSLFPRHVVTPEYPLLPRTAHVSGELVLLVTIAADGTVADAKRISGPPLLEKLAVKTVQMWTFERPAAAPFTQTMSFDYKFLDKKECPGDGLGTPTEVAYDFPAKVTISACPHLILDATPQIGKTKK